MLLLFALACIPLPYVAPPLDLGVALDPLPAPVGAPGAGSSPQAVDVRVGLAPLSSFESFRTRRFDPTGGFVVSFRDLGGAGVANLGGYLRLAMRTKRWDHGGSYFVVEPRVTADVLVNQKGRVGGDALLGVAIRAAGWTDAQGGGSASVNGGWIGVSHGEWGIALALDAGPELTPRGTVGGRLLLGLEFRAPASAGVMLVPIY